MTVSLAKRICVILTLTIFIVIGANIEQFCRITQIGQCYQNEAYSSINSYIIPIHCKNMKDIATENCILDDKTAAKLDKHLDDYIQNNRKQKQTGNIVMSPVNERPNQIKEIPIYKNRSHKEPHKAIIGKPHISMDAYLTEKKKQPNPDMLSLLRKHNSHNVGVINSIDKCTSHTVAFGMGLTTKGSYSRINDLMFFKILLPSLCKTVSNDYCYTFYVAYDFNDKLLSNAPNRDIFQRVFTKSIKELCPIHMAIGLHLIQCNYSGKPAWSQNEAMMHAQADNMTYFYMINDDTMFITENWTSIFAKALADMVPPNVGLVGPTVSNIYKSILTYNFVHKTHFDIFGYFYPKYFTDWFADDWITLVYKPYHMKMLRDVRVKHAMIFGQRYNAHLSAHQYLAHEVLHGQRLLNSYIHS